MEQPFADPAWHVSPCAYLVGLLRPVVVEELQLQRFGYRVALVDPRIGYATVRRAVLRFIRKITHTG